MKGRPNKISNKKFTGRTAYRDIRSRVAPLSKKKEEKAKRKGEGGSIRIGAVKRDALSPRKLYDPPRLCGEEKGME